MRKIIFHTNSAAPYRKHQFELLTKTFPSAEFWFIERNRNEGRSWSYDCSNWDCDCRIMTPRSKMRRLLTQPFGTVHVVAYAGSMIYRLLLALSSYIGHSKTIEWNDAAFPETVDKKARCKWHPWTRLYNWFVFHSQSGVYTAGDLGRRWALARGYKPNQIINTYFSHDTDKFVAYHKAHYADARVRIRKELGIADDEVSSLNISRYLDWKRLRDLAQAFTELESKRPDLAKKSHVVIIGEGECQNHIPILQQLKLVRVHLIKQMPPDDVMGYYCAADLFVFPSEGDIWGLVVNEALSMGLPVVCTDRIGASEVVHEGENGYRVPIRRPDLIAEKIMILTGNTTLRKQFSDNATTIVSYWRSELAIIGLKRHLLWEGA